MKRRVHRVRIPRPAYSTRVRPQGGRGLPRDEAPVGRAIAHDEDGPWHGGFEDSSIVSRISDQTVTSPLQQATESNQK